ncbi:MAG: hypothetical protein JNK11_15925 [Alphaproteobacteria bacterium]|nr:hypothetical protein [Alphaproteobacteria bacterium]
MVASVARAAASAADPIVEPFDLTAPVAPLRRSSCRALRRSPAEAGFTDSPPAESSR